MANIKGAKRKPYQTTLSNKQDKMVEMFEGGMTKTDIAKELKCGRGAVTKQIELHYGIRKN